MFSALSSNELRPGESRAPPPKSGFGSLLSSISTPASD
jgi:hypothetical protein